MAWALMIFCVFITELGICLLSSRRVVLPAFSCRKDSAAPLSRPLISSGHQLDGVGVACSQFPHQRIDGLQVVEDRAVGGREFPAPMAAGLQ